MADQSYHPDSVSAQPRAKRRKTGGRVAGTPNKATVLRRLLALGVPLIERPLAPAPAPPALKPLLCPRETPKAYRKRLRRNRRLYAADPAIRRAAADKARVSKYGLTNAEFDTMVRDQAGRCRSCDDPMGPGPRQLHVDHCHFTGRVRGLLCGGCNTALGAVQDSPRRLRQLAEYIDDHHRFMADLAAFIEVRRRAA